MPLTKITRILDKAKKEGYAVGAFEFWSLDSVLAVANAAKAAGRPVIIQAGKAECDYAGGAKYLAKLGRMVAEDCPVDVALHFDHSDSVSLAEEAIDAGFDSVMIDGSQLAYEQNVEMTARVVQIAARAGVAVEGELGTIGGAEGAIVDTRGEEGLTDPALVTDFLAKTGVDILAVGIGTAHGLHVRQPKVSIERLREIAAQTDIPLVRHGGSGLSDEVFTDAIRNGISKINICTEIIAAMGRAIYTAQEPEGFKYSVKSLFGPGYDAAAALIEKRIRLFGLEENP